MSIFQNKFFSAAGQKERISNVVNVLKIATTGKDVKGQKTQIVANTNSKITNKAFETIANHPYITAGVIAGGMTAVKAVSKSSAIVGASSAAKSSAVISGTAKTALIAGGAGIIAGSIFSGGSKSSSQPKQITTPKQETSQSVSPNQGVNQTPYIMPSQKGAIDVSGYGNTVKYRQSQDTYTYNYAQPFQYTQPTQIPTQTTSPEQTATSEAGTSVPWVALAIVGVGAYVLFK